jgi:hypothetical protein
MLRIAFHADGFALAPHLLEADECRAIADRIAPASAISGGTRSLLSEPWCADLAARLRAHPNLASLLPRGLVAVQCAYFEKTAARNWLVPIHQDLSIPVAARVDDPSLRGWSEKEGSLFVQPPADVLEQLVAARLHLDPCGPDDGPLRVVPGSHLRGRIDEPETALAIRAAAGEVTCAAAVGDALLMRPLLLHASSKAAGASRRRVLHFLFGPSELPCGLRWSQTV